MLAAEVPAAEAAVADNRRDLLLAFVGRGLLVVAGGFLSAAADGQGQMQR
jgi:hypothetical protein